MIYSSRLLAGLRFALYVLAIVTWLPLIAVNLWWPNRGSERVLLRFHRLCCALFGIKRVIKGEICRHRPCFFVANHISYLDIVVLGAEIQASFISKAEVAAWPIFGFLAKLQRSMFLNRHRTATASHKAELQKRFLAGDNLIIFAEGTTGDGNHILPFRSSLFAVVEDYGEDYAGAQGELWIQPVTLAYTKLDGFPLGREGRALIAWYGDMTFMAHLMDFLGLGQVTVEIEFHAARPASEFASRKEVAEYSHKTVRSAYELALQGR